jgi:hypothetical protein
VAVIRRCLTLRSRQRCPSRSDGTTSGQGPKVESQIAMIHAPRGGGHPGDPRARLTQGGGDATTETAAGASDQRRRSRQFMGGCRRWSCLSLQFCRDPYRRGPSHIRNSGPGGRHPKVEQRVESLVPPHGLSGHGFRRACLLPKKRPQGLSPATRGSATCCGGQAARSPPAAGFRGPAGARRAAG